MNNATGRSSAATINVSRPNRVACASSANATIVADTMPMKIVARPNIS
jgi:hypothetical protein